MASEPVAHSELEFVEDCVADGVPLEVERLDLPGGLRRRFGCRNAVR